MRKATCKKENQTAGVKFHKLYAWLFILFASICGLLLVVWLVGCGEDYWEETEDLLLPEQLADEAADIPQEVDEADDRAQEVEEVWRVFQILITDVANAIDVTNHTTRDYAVGLAAKCPGEYNIGQICAIFDDIRGRWRYVNDPRGRNYVSPASRTIQLGFAGDCDDFAVVLAALIECIGGATRVVLGLREDGDSHAYAEVFMGFGAAVEPTILESMNVYYRSVADWLLGRSPVKDAHYHVGAFGERWLNLDYSAIYPGGPLYPADAEIVVYSNGDYELY